MAATATGIFHTSYASELRLRHTGAERFRMLAALAAVIALPWTLDNYWLGIANLVGIAVIGAVGLNILVGYTGQISLGQGGFLAVGAFTSATLAGKAGLPVPVAMLGAILLTAVVGALFGLPALRLKGLYLAIATLAAQFILQDFFARAHWFTGGVAGTSASPFSIFGFKFDTDPTFFYVVLFYVVVCFTLVTNLMRTRDGRGEQDRAEHGDRHG